MDGSGRPDENTPGVDQSADSPQVPPAYAAFEDSELFTLVKSYIDGLGLIVGELQRRRQKKKPPPQPEMKFLVKMRRAELFQSAQLLLKAGADILEELSRRKQMES